MYVNTINKTAAALFDFAEMATAAKSEAADGMGQATNLTIALGLQIGAIITIAVNGKTQVS